MKNTRRYSKWDELCLGVDQALKSIFGNAKTTARSYPAENEPEPNLTAEQRKQSASLMRVNHAGEVCAQALYHGQACTSRQSHVKEKMQQAAIEEGDHLAWCNRRITELGNHTSYLNPLWYMGSFAIGFTAGLVGDKYSLGFLAETESQVVKHLQHQMDLLPSSDEKSYKILKQMEIDEAQHREDAMKAGAAELPSLVKKWMNFTSQVMVKTAYWI